MKVRQTFDSPTVYLDHWAIRMFTDDSILQNRFVNAIKSKSGTLLLSNISFAEFAVASDGRHSQDAENFVKRILPNIFLTDFAFDKILEQERAETDNVKRFWPSTDLAQLKLFAERAYQASQNFSTIHGLFSLAHTNKDEINKLTAELVEQIKVSMQSQREDPSYVAKARITQPNDKRPRTIVILGELMRSFVLDPSAPLKDNDITDMLHATMPVNCCDYVLLDGAWAERVEKMKRRIKKIGANMPLAKCFSIRNHGVEKFLCDLEDFSQPN